jgi:hypothetical protein
MANYNYGGGSFSGFSTTPWSNAMSAIAPQFNPFQQGMYNSDPALAMEHFIRTVMPSNINEDLMRRMLPNIQRQWVQQQMQDASNGLGTLRPFSSMLTNHNWDRELARLSPDVRRESSSLFQRPVRTITF